MRIEATCIGLQTITANKKMNAKIIHLCQGREAADDRPVWERFPKESDTGRWLQSSRKVEYSREPNRPFNYLIQADLLQFPLIISGREGRS